MWGLKIKGKFEPVALRTRAMVQVYAGRRMLPGEECKRTFGRDDISEFMPEFGDAAGLWKAVKHRYPSAEIVRVRVIEHS